MNNVSLSYYFDQRRVLKSGKYPLRIRISYNGDVRIISTPFTLSLSEYKSVLVNKRPKGTQKTLRMQIDEFYLDTQKKVLSQKHLSFSLLKQTNTAPQVVSLNQIYEKTIDIFVNEERLKTAKNYESSLSSFKSYVEHFDICSTTFIPFKVIDKSFLVRYESWMLNNNKSLATVGIYTRALRAVINIAIDESYIESSMSPFKGNKKNKYIIPAIGKVKKALDKEQLIKLHNYKVEEGSSLDYAKDLWFFSYSCFGMNLKDMAELKVSDMSDDTISFFRSKTINTSRTNLKRIMIPLTDFSRSIIEKWKDSYSVYLFPIYSPEMTALEKYTALGNCNRMINNKLLKLAKKASISSHISFQTARHTFTTLAIRNGAPMELISESLGHSSLKTTMNYWSGFEESRKIELANSLVDITK